jgi:hypothetical protein
VRTSDIALPSVDNANTNNGIANDGDDDDDEETAARWHADALRRLVVVLCERGQVIAPMLSIIVAY